MELNILNAMLNMDTITDLIATQFRLISEMKNNLSNEFYFEVRLVLVTFICILVCINMFQKVRKWKRMPPGPWGFPIVGHLPLLGKLPHKTFNNMKREYGDVFSIRMGSWSTVVLNSREVIHEALVKKQDIFADRPAFFSAAKINDGRSLTFGKYNARWKIHWKIGNKVLRMFTNIKNNPTEELIQNEALLLAQDLIANTTNGEMNPDKIIFAAVGSILYQICYGKDKHCKEKEDLRCLMMQAKTSAEFVGAGNPVDVMPWLQYFMPWKTRKFLDLTNTVENFWKKKIGEHLTTFDENCLRDAADGFILAAKKLEQSEKRTTGITEENIHSTLQDVTAAGFETVATTLEWSLLYMTVFPEVQDRVQTEIDYVIGERKPKIQDREKMPYTEATILEILRMCTIVPLGLPHATTDDVIIQNYIIPKGTVVFANLYATAQDKTVWQNPDRFQPERFLTNENEINLEAAEYIMSFGAGRRRCLGEYLAKIKLFIFFATLLQQCKFEALSGVKYDLEGVFGITNKSAPYTVKVSSRY